MFSIASSSKNMVRVRLNVRIRLKVRVRFNDRVGSKGRIWCKVRVQIRLRSVRYQLKENILVKQEYLVKNGLENCV